MRLYLSHKDKPETRWEILQFDPANHNMILRGERWSMQQLIMRMPDLKAAGFVIAQEEGTRELWYHPESDSYVEEINPELPIVNRDPLLTDVTGIFDHEVQHFLRGTYVADVREETGAVFDVITDPAVQARAAEVTAAVVQAANEVEAAIAAENAGKPVDTIKGLEALAMQAEP